MKRSHLFLLTLLLLLTACGSGASSQSAVVATPHPALTPTVGITPIPTIPNVPFRTVQFLTSDNIKLAGWLYGHGKTMVICSHELRTSKVIWSVSGIPQRLATRGYQVLAYDFRGDGDSEGQANTETLDVDLHAAVAFAHKLGATKIVLLGSSMGGTATLKVAAREQVAAVITLSAPQDFGPGLSDAEVKAIKAPKLFVNSQNDDYANITMHMYSIASSPKEIHLYSGSAHGTSIFDNPEDGSDLTQRLLDFVARYAPAN